MDLSTTYLGMTLRTPLVPSASPLSEDLDSIRRMEDAGAAAVVLYSLFEEQLVLDKYELHHHLTAGTESFAEALSYFPEPTEFHLGPEGYLDHIRKAKAAVSIPVIASLNGVSAGGWVQYAKKIQEAGADALELNTYYVAANPAQSSSEVEEMYLDLVREVKSDLRIPVAVKLGPFFSAFANMAQCLDRASADGLVLFNRFYQPDFDLENLEVTSDLNLSNSYELRLRLRWVAFLYGAIKADMAVTGGVHSGCDVLKAMMAGANVAMTTSSLLHNGVEHLSKIVAEVEQWMQEHEYESIRQMRGSMSQKNVPMPTLFERANYIKILRSYRVPA